MRIPRGRGQWLVAKTCVGCGELKDAAEFPLRHHATARDSLCHACKVAATRAWRRERQDPDKAAETLAEWHKNQKEDRERRQRSSIPGARRRGRRWSAAEVALVAREDLTVDEKAALLGRTFHAVTIAEWRLRNDPQFASLLTQ